jgi:hypothetical protein
VHRVFHSPTYRCAVHVVARVRSVSGKVGDGVSGGSKGLARWVCTVTVLWSCHRSITPINVHCTSTRTTPNVFGCTVHQAQNRVAVGVDDDDAGQGAVHGNAKQNHAPPAVAQAWSAPGTEVRWHFRLLATRPSAP